MGSGGKFLSTLKKAAEVAGDVLTTKGDILSRSASALGRLPVSTNNFSLLCDSAQTLGIKWGASATSTLTTAGDLLYASGANTLARLAKGTDNQVLKMNGTALNWETLPAGGGKLELIEDYTEGSSTGTTKTFTVTEDPDNSSCLVIDYSLGVSGSCDILLQLNGNAGTGEYEINGTSIDGGTETLIGASSTSFEVCPSEILSAGDSTGCGRIIIYTPEAGTTRPSILATATGQNTARYYSIAGCMFVATSSITSIVVKVSTSSWKQNSNITLYRCAK